MWQDIKLKMSLNNSIFYLINNLSTISWIADLAIFLSYLFTYLLLFILIIWAIFFSQKKMFNFSLLFLSGIFSWFMANILKSILRINRPFIDLEIIPLHSEIGFSFPSEHMTVFTTIAMVMFLINKKVGFIFLLIAILIGLSRIVIGVHYPLDILGGLFLGSLIGFIFIKIFKKI